MTQVSAGLDPVPRAHLHPKVSVCLITYNHERFIEAALEGIERQSTPFDVQVVVADDHSTDGTRDVIGRFVKRASRRYEVLPSERNVGITANLDRALSSCRGQYVALLEGDDYWTDAQKLSLQACHLDRHPECAVCFHPVWGIDEWGQMRSSRPWPKVWRSTFTLDDLLKRGNFIPTSSTMFRRGLFGPLPDWYCSHWIGDLPLHVLNAQFGTVELVKSPMAAYRIHPGGAFSAARQEVRVAELLEVYEDLAGHLQTSQRRSIGSMQAFLRAAECVRTGKDEQARRFAAKRALSRPHNLQALKAVAIWGSPAGYRALSEYAHGWRARHAG